MFANLKKKIESEVGDLSRLAPSNVLNRTNSSTLSSRHPSVSSLTSEPPNLNASQLQAPLSPNPVEFSSVTPSRGGGGGGGGGSSGGHSLLGIKVKQLEEKLQAQESDFAWRLSTKDDEIGNLNKTIEILTGQLRSQDSEVKKKLVRVQEDIDDLEGFSQQENAKLKHLLLNKEEQLTELRNDVFRKGQEVEELRGRLREVEVENQRVKVNLEKLNSSGGGNGRIEEVEGERDKAVKEVQRLLGEVSKVRGGFEEQVKTLAGERDRLRGELEGKVAVETGLQKSVEERGRRISELEGKYADAIVKVELLGKQMEEVKKVNAEKQGSEVARIREVEAECERLRIENSELLRGKGELEGKVAAGEGLSVQVEEKGRRIVELEGQYSDVVKGSEVLSKQVEELRKAAQEKHSSDVARIREVESECERLRNENAELIARRSELEGKEGEVVKAIGVERDRLRAELEGKIAAERELQKSVEERGRKIAELEGKYADAMVKIEVLVGQMEEVKETSAYQLGAEVARIREVESECERLKNENCELMVKKSELEGEELRALGVERDRLRRELELAGERIRAVDMEKESCGGKVKELEEKGKQLFSEFSVMKRRCEEMDAEGVQREGKLKAVEAEKNELLKEVERVTREFQGKVDGLQGEVQRERGKVSEIEGKLLECTREIEELRRVRGEIEGKIGVAEAMQMEVDESARRIVELEGKCAEAERKYHGVQEELEGLKKGAAEKESSDVARIREITQECEVLRTENSELLRRSAEVKGEVDGEVQALKEKCAEVENEKDELIVNVSEVQARVDELEEEVSSMKNVQARVEELEGVVAEKDKQLRQQSHALADLRRSLAKELKVNHKTQKSEDNSSSVPATSAAAENGSSSSSSSSSNHMNGSIVRSQQHEPLLSDSAASSGGGAATLPQYETDVNFMYLRSVLFKYLTSQDPQITSHLTRVVATLLHLTEEETNTLMQSMESRSNQHLLSHIIK